ncbi:PAAR domain-containing protein [Pseudomonas sp. W2-17]|uniref:PAAR domain-containing protein n=1 Tax=Pseudomonas sp. W2-17 TaxID=3058039 RepID=UPI0034E0BB9B
MAIGYYIRLYDKTSCGGFVTQATSRMVLHGIEQSREGDAVKCGVDGKTYRIRGGISHRTSDGIRLAGTLDSVSGCPCRARLEASLFCAIYESEESAAALAAKPSSAAGDRQGAAVAAKSMPLSARRTADAQREQDLEEEEEEEVEQKQLITLRLGVFFDGTGNNQANSETVAGCMAQDVGLGNEAEEIQKFCAEFGYGIDGSAPDNSFGNETSNVARLYDLYRDHSDVSIEPDAEEAALKVYLEGIGTVSGGEDDLWGQATGIGKNGVVARVEQSSALIVERLLRFNRNNPEVTIRRLEIDIFGFSRGAAAARHFANDIRKGVDSLLAKALPTDKSMFVEGFGWRVQDDLHLNFIGLFDTVPAIVTPLMLDFSPGNDRNGGLNLGLPTGAARKVVHLVARDEHRLNFALIRTDNDIVLPGSHSDIGGGYRPRMRERLLVAKPASSQERKSTANEQSLAFSQSIQSVGPLVRRLIDQGLEVDIHCRSEDDERTQENQIPLHKQVYVLTTLDREVEGDLSKIYLRVMRELAVQHGAPLDVINDRDQRLSLPTDLATISAKILDYATGRRATLDLNTAEEALLLLRYIHLSASWNAVKDRNRTSVGPMFINRPTNNHQRIVHGNR